MRYWAISVGREPPKPTSRSTIFPGFKIFFSVHADFPSDFNRNENADMDFQTYAKRDKHEAFAIQNRILETEE
jgi:hypothetical protein